MEESYSGSLDAALSLFEAVLAGWTLSYLTQNRNPDNGQHPDGTWTAGLFGVTPDSYKQSEAKSTSPSRALLIAILESLVGMEEG